MTRPGARALRSSLAIAGCASSLVGCPDSNREGRSCEGLRFDHPRAEVWADYREGDRLVFAGPNATVEYAVVRVEEPRPEGAIGFVGQEDVPCTLVRRIVLSEADADLEIEIRLEQDERASQPPDEELLVADVDARLPSAGVATDLGLLWLEPLERNATAGGDQRIVRELVSGGRRYGLSVAFPAVDSVDELYLSRSDRIESFAFSEGVGLSALERPDVGPLHLDQIVRAGANR